MITLLYLLLLAQTLLWEEEKDEMHFSNLLLGAGLVPLALAAYVVEDDYSGNNFFDMFTFDTVRGSFGLPHLSAC